MRRLPCFLAFAASLASTAALAAPSAGPLPSDVVRAARLAAEATRRLKADDGELWGRPVAAPFLFVRGDRVYATLDPRVPELPPLPERSLPDGLQLWSGPLPAGLSASNTAVVYAQLRWAMVVLPLPPADADALRLLIHESFHVWQPTVLKVKPYSETGPGSDLLDQPEGRTWLRMEWLALEDALSSERASDEQLARILLFRARRLQAATPEERDRERLLELVEGAAEYTGWRLSGGARADLLRALQEAPKNPTYVRSFPYSTGPAYGALLEQRIPRSWRFDAAEAGDLALLLAGTMEPIAGAWARATLEGNASRDAVDARARREGAAYKLEAVRKEEERRWATRKRQLAELKARFVDGPTLRIRPGDLRVSFDPRASTPLGDAGTVLASVGWKTDSGAELSAPGGALVSHDWKELRVPLDRSLRLTAGPLPAKKTWRARGWSLTLPEGWTLGAEKASFVAAPAAPAAPPPPAAPAATSTP